MDRDYGPPGARGSQARASSTMLNGVRAATRATGNPACSKAAISSAGPAWAPSAAPPWSTLAGTQSTELAAK